MAPAHRTRAVLGVAATIAAAVAASTVVGGSPASGRAPVTELTWLGEQIVPTGTVFAGTRIGGLSSLAYDADRDVFYALSDDQGVLGPVRFYTLHLDVADGRLDDGDVRFLDVTELLDAPGQPFAPGSLDPEGIALTKDDELIVTSEGISSRGIAPFVRRFSLDGQPLGALPVPDAYLPTSATHGVRQNLGFESAAVPPNGRFLLAGAENALAQDGPAASTTAASPARLLTYDLQRGVVASEHVYWTDPIAEPPVPAGAFAVSGLVEILPLNNEHVLTMERSFSVGAPGTGNTIKLYDADLAGADDVHGLDSLAGVLDDVRAVDKTLLLDLDTLGIPLDNIEGMAFGPRLPDGRRSLLLVSDDNFSPAGFTQFLLFAVG